MRKVFLDTNIIIDYIKNDRGIHDINAEQIFGQCVRGEIECYIAPHTVSNLFYVLRKDYSTEARKLIISSLCKLCKVQPLDGNLIEQALNDKRFDDLEDALQMACAEKCGADLFVTRDANGFHKSKIKISNHYLSETEDNLAL